MKKKEGSPRHKSPAAAAERMMGFASRLYQNNQGAFRLSWDVLNIGVIGLNSFIFLLYKSSGYEGLDTVICFGAAAYALILLGQAVFFRRQSAKRQEAVYQTKRIFRLIYTALYLTKIMLDVIRITAQPAKGQEGLLAYYGFLFIWVSLWGTNCLWMQKALGWIRVLWENRCRKKEEINQKKLNITIDITTNK